jgi:hypothetical protein
VSLPEIALAAGRPAHVELVDSRNGARPRRATGVELLDEESLLRVRFDVESPEPRATLRARDADLWTEDVVELFVAPGVDPPAVYYEMELNPLGTLFDARVESPRGERSSMRVDRGWDCAGIAVRVVVAPGRGWSAELVIPWREIGGEEHDVWRINLFRIDRPPGGEAEFSAWSPTLVSPPDFHRPARFGILRRLG